MNKVFLMGNLGTDAELKKVNDNSVLNFRIAVNQTWKDAKGEKKERTDWFSCALWGKRAEALAQYLTKGTRLVVEGELRTREYEKDGVKHYATDINVSNVEFAGGGKREGGSNSVSDDEFPPKDEEPIKDFGSNVGGETASFDAPPAKAEKKKGKAA
jgi:single-strand DNA-binding protein